MTPAASRTRRRARPLVALAAVGLLAACAVAEASTAAPSELVAGAVAATGAPTSAPDPTDAPDLTAATDATDAADAAEAGTAEATAPTLHVGPRLRVGLRSAATWEGRATYRLQHETGQAEVTVSRLAGSVRVDVAAGGATSSLIGTDSGTVACQVTDRTSCLLVAAPGAPVPPAFDTGLGELLFTTVPGLADLSLGVSDDGWTGAGTDGAGQPVAAAACAAVVSRDVQYCVTEAGLVRRAVFAAGTLTLVSSVPDVDPAVFTAPVPAVPLA